MYKSAFILQKFLHIFYMGINFLLALEIKKPYNPPCLGHSLTVELRTLTPSVLVRIQLPQPRFYCPLFGGVFLLDRDRNKRIILLIIYSDVL